MNGVRLWTEGRRIDGLTVEEACARAKPGSTIELDLAPRLRNAEELRLLADLDMDVVLQLRDMEGYPTRILGRVQLHALAGGVEKWLASLSEATRDGIRKAQDEGLEMGGDRGYTIQPEHAEKGRTVWADQQAQKREQLEPIARGLREEGSTLQQIADHFNEAGFPTLSGRGRWNPSTVRRLL